MMAENEKHRPNEKGHFVDVAKTRRRGRAGQMHHNLETPVEGGQPIEEKQSEVESAAGKQAREEPQK
jgi:hypothetical protein